MRERADQTIRQSLERLLFEHFENRSYRRLAFIDSEKGAVSGRGGDPGRRDAPCGMLEVHQQFDDEDIMEFRAELRLAAPLEQERFLIDHMLEAIDVLHEADMIDSGSAPPAMGDPVIIGISFKTAVFERLLNSDETAANLVFSVRATPN